MFDYQPLHPKDIQLVHDELPVGPLSFLFAPEISVITYEDYNDKIHFEHLPFGERLNLAYVLPPKGGFDTLLQAVAAFNTMNAQIDIYCQGKTIDNIKQYSNEHIEYHDIDKEIVEIKANAIITYALGSLYFIKKRIPVLIMGPNGLGGWVTPDNFHYLTINGFMGRPGGTLWEGVPAFVLTEELISIKECKHLDTLLENNNQLASTLKYIPAYQAYAAATELANRYNLAFENDRRWLLRPAIGSNIHFVSDAGIVYIRRKYLNDTIASIEDEHFAFLTNIDGRNNFESIYRKANMLEDDFWELMYSLLEQKIIIL